MLCQTLSAEQYRNFIHTRNSRVFLQQLPEYADILASRGDDVDYFGVVDKGTVLAAGVITYQPWKRFFKRAHLIFGPTLDWSDSRLVSTYINGLMAFLRKKRNVVAVRCNPIVARAFYDDIEITGSNPEADAVVKILADNGFTRINREFYEQHDIEARFIYTKNIDGMDFDEACASTAKALRRRFKHEGRYGVQTRFLTAEELDIFNDLHKATEKRAGIAGISPRQMDLYRGLLEKMGERAHLCVAFFRPGDYLAQIDEDDVECRERLALLETRKQTKARDREIAELNERIEHNVDLRAATERDLAEYGEEVPINSAFGFESGRELVLILGGMDKKFTPYARDYPVERALFKLACDRNMAIYNTFGITGDFSPNASDAAVLSFKRFLNGQVEEFIGTYVAPVRGTLAKVLGALS